MCTRSSTTATSASIRVFGLHVSPRLREEFGNGEQFYERARLPIALPVRRTDRPSREFLEWHLDTVFKD